MEVVQLTHGEGAFFHPTWSFDGESLAFNHAPDVPWRGGGIYAVSSHGGAVRRLAQLWVKHPSWSPRGNEIAVVAYVIGKGYTHLAILDTLTSQVRTIVTGSIEITDPECSPDGSRIVFWIDAANSTGDSQIIVVNRDGTRGRVLVWDGGREPSWSPDGRHIVYVKLTYRARDRVGNGRLWILDADGRNKRQLTF
jgi:Tol biopolymer transport system component